MDGTVEALFIGPQPQGEVRRVDEVRAVAGRGLEGDRYFANGEHDPSDEITVFSAEELEEARRESGLAIPETDLRRNVMTRGVDVGSLVGTTFRLGQVVVEALEDNPACSHLQRLAGAPILEPLARRGGVRGRIVRGGTIRVGDRVDVAALEEEPA